ncbi:MAG: MmcQ/YjbR family DNA-binding protein [Actinomycetales bacterium]|nr:MmcQ/YjbR family DNA-binding protein [Actinomycetales bacterium]
MAERPEVPAALIRRLDEMFAELPETYREDAWVGERWRVGQATVAHVFGGEDQQFRIVFRAPDSEVMTFANLGPSHFRAGWGRNVVGVIIDEDTDFEDLEEMLIESYCLQAPARLVAQLDLPPAGP